MNSKLVKASLAGVAAIALAAGGSTYAAFSDFGDIQGNTIGAGFLKLDLRANGTGSNTPISWGQLAPNNLHTQRMVWVASNDGQSVPSATLSVTFKNLVDTAAPCTTSLGKAAADPGCSVDSSDNISGTPTQGLLSRVLNVQTQYYPTIADPATCEHNTDFPAGAVSIFPSHHPGDLHDYANQTFTLKTSSASNAPNLLLAPGHGVCIGIDTYWGGGNDAVAWGGPVDNAAQGDSLKFDMHFDLTQPVDPNNP
jgi:predicted ribosomally synthesized peptide with SipW-like signal peptide